MTTMTTSQRFFMLIAKARRLQSALEAVEGLDRAFRERVKEMLEGTGKPLSPKEVEAFTMLIEQAKESRQSDAKELAQTLREIVAILGDRFKDE